MQLFLYCSAVVFGFLMVFFFTIFFSSFLDFGIASVVNSCNATETGARVNQDKITRIKQVQVQTPPLVSWCVVFYCIALKKTHFTGDRSKTILGAIERRGILLVLPYSFLSGVLFHRSSVSKLAPEPPGQLHFVNLSTISVIASALHALFLSMCLH